MNTLDKYTVYKGSPSVGGAVLEGVELAPMEPMTEGLMETDQSPTSKYSKHFEHIKDTAISKVRIVFEGGRGVCVEIFVSSTCNDGLTLYRCQFLVGYPITMCVRGSKVT